MVDRELKQAIEACRPGSDDVSLPEMSQLAQAIDSDAQVRELYDRSQQCDGVIGAAFRDVPVPDGLAERLLAAVSEADSKAPEETSSGTKTTPSDGDLPTPKQAPANRRARQRWLHISCGLAAALSLSLLVILVIYNTGTDEPIANERLQQDIDAWKDLTVEEGWQENFADPTLDKRPWPRAITIHPARWCRIETRYDDSTIAYDLARPGEEKFAYLFCMQIKMSGSTLPKAPPVKPYALTGRTCLGVWRRGDMVYVLAVQGRADRYKEFLGSSFIDRLGDLNTAATFLTGILTPSFPDSMDSF